MSRFAVHVLRGGELDATERAALDAAIDRVFTARARAKDDGGRASTPAWVRAGWRSAVQGTIVRSRTGLLGG